MKKKAKGKSRAAAQAKRLAKVARKRLASGGKSQYAIKHRGGGNTGPHGMWRVVETGGAAPAPPRYASPAVQRTRAGFGPDLAAVRQATKVATFGGHCYPLGWGSGYTSQGEPA